MSQGGVFLPDQVSRVNAVDDEVARLALGCPGPFNGLEVVQRDTGARFHCVDLTVGVFDWLEVGGGGAAPDLEIVLDYEDASQNGETSFASPIAGTISKISVVNSLLTSGSANEFALAVNGSTVDNGDVFIPSGTALRSVTSNSPTDGNIVAVDDVVSVLVQGGSNVYVAGITITIVRA